MRLDHTAHRTVWANPAPWAGQGVELIVERIAEPGVTIVEARMGAASVRVDVTEYRVEVAAELLGVAAELLARDVLGVCPSCGAELLPSERDGACPSCGHW